MASSLYRINRSALFVLSSANKLSSILCSPRQHTRLIIPSNLNSTSSQVSGEAKNPNSTLNKSDANLSSTLWSKQWQGKKKKPSPASVFNDDSLKRPSFAIRAYATADYYNLDTLGECLVKSGAYEVVQNLNESGQLDEPTLLDECLCVRPKYKEIDEIEPRHIFLFENGSVVFWNVSETEQSTILNLVDKNAQMSYPVSVVDAESETMEYYRLEPGDELARNRNAGLVQNCIFLKSSSYDTPSTNLLEKYAFSDAISASVKLGIWERRLVEFAEKIHFVSGDMKRGSMIKLSSEEVLRLLGELFAMRHVINLHSNFLGQPDFYWDREKLGTMYDQLYVYLSVDKRVRLFNERVNHCIDLMEILKQNLNDKKHTRLGNM